MTRPGSEPAMRGATGSGVAPALPEVSEDGPWLDIEDSDGRRFTFRLESETVRIGRKGDNEIRLSDPHISKYHAEIRKEGNRFIITDLESKAGLLVNGLRTMERVLADGDLIVFGQEPPPSMLFRWGRSPEIQTPDLAVTTFLETVTLDGRGRGLEKLALFLEFMRLSGGRIALDEVLANVVDVAVEVTGAERGFLILMGSGETLEYRVARGRDRTSLPEEATRASETIVRKVLADGVAMVVPDIGLQEDLAEVQSVALFALRSALALPLRRLASSGGDQGEVFGVLYLDSQQTQRSFTAIDRDILEALARDASSAIENARLLREAEEKRTLEQEVTRARAVQTALLPAAFWCDGHFEVAGTCVPSRALGGDYLDQFRLPDGRCCLLIADVSGKGLPAALLAASLQGAISAEGIRDQSLGAMAGRINRALCRRLPAGRFVTFFCCALSAAGELAWVNAGHVPPVAVRSAGRMESLFSGDMALGFREESEYSEGVLILAPGDTVTLYTDGVTEAAARGGEMFGESRLEALLAASQGRTAEEIVQAITAAVREYATGAPQQDDITVLALRYLGPAASDSRRPS